MCQYSQTEVYWIISSGHSGPLKAADPRQMQSRAQLVRRYAASSPRSCAVHPCRYASSLCPRCQAALLYILSFIVRSGHSSLHSPVETGGTHRLRPVRDQIRSVLLRNVSINPISLPTWCFLAERNSHQIPNAEAEGLRNRNERNSEMRSDDRRSRNALVRMGEGRPRSSVGLRLERSNPMRQGLHCLSILPPR